ncbi:hypothetical protein GF325_19215 [Candidatus Bathyarchaeota archaeon]|nr:hypothetical protein [Candidatus Bathyarchaeota archaeon]
MKILAIGFDIGGANVKVASAMIPVVMDTDAILESAFVTRKYFPLWKNSIDLLENVLHDSLLKHVEHHESLLASGNPCTIRVAATITGELSDAFNSKKEGIMKISGALSLACERVRNMFLEVKPLLKIKRPVFYGIDGHFRELDEAIEDWRIISAANWHATARWLGTRIKNGLLIDCGSTTTDIIPIIGHHPCTKGSTDFERLMSGELVYTGILRATIPSISHEVPVGEKMVPVSFEKFAIMADVYLILGMISPEDYTCETPDGREKNSDAACRRLARHVCEDASELGHQKIMDMAKYLHAQQVKRIATSVKQVMQWVQNAREGKKKKNLIAYGTGLGEEILIEPAVKAAGIREQKLSAHFIGKEHSISSSAIGILFIIILDSCMGESLAE